MCLSISHLSQGGGCPREHRCLPGIGGIESTFVLEESLRLRRAQDVPMEAEKDEEGDEWEEWEDEEYDNEVEVAVKGVFKRWSHLTEEDLQLMTDEEYVVFVELCQEDDIYKSIHCN